PMLAPMLAAIVLSAVFPDHADGLARTAGTVAAISAVLMFLSGFGSNSAFVLELLISPAMLVAVGLVTLAFLSGRISGDLAGPTLTVTDGPAILSSQRKIAAARRLARSRGGSDGRAVAGLP